MNGKEKHMHAVNWNTVKQIYYLLLKHHFNITKCDVQDHKINVWMKGITPGEYHDLPEPFEIVETLFIM